MNNENTQDKSPKQKLKDGVGPIYHRIYRVSFDGTLEDARKAMRSLQVDINSYSPQLLARFEKTCGCADKLVPGDEFQIHITGPWNGPVRVTESGCDDFKLVTLEGHLEAGEIHFQIKSAGDDRVTFEIESLARSRDAIIDFVYDKVPIAKAAQTEMWTCFCRRFAEHACEIANSNKESVSEVDVLTERRDEETGQWQKL